jgi:hypothetical protein
MLNYFLYGFGQYQLVFMFSYSSSLLLDRFYTIIEVGVHILIGVSHILCKGMIDMLPEIVELIHQRGKSPFLSMQYDLMKYQQFSIQKS